MTSTELSVIKAAEEVPERVAIVVQGREVTYRQLSIQVKKAILWLQRRDPVARVAMVALPTFENLVTLLALFELGQPVVLMHPRLTAPERRRMVTECGPVRFLEGTWAVAPRPRRPADRTPPKPALPPPPPPETCLAVIFTAGSRGVAKGVVLSRRAFLASAAASADNLGWEANDRWLLSLPIAHVGGLSILTRCLIARRTVVVPDDDHFDPEALIKTIVDKRVTLLSLVPAMLRQLLSRKPAWRLPQRLRAILVGGAAVSPDLLRQSADRKWPVLTTYGLTEACSQVASQRLGSVNRGEKGCGPPVLGMEVRTDADVIEIRGANLLDGYLSGGVFSTPVSADGWFATGDVGVLDADGCLHVQGRRDDVIVTGGENVHPLEVEAALLAHPAIEGACVFGFDDDEWGQVVTAALVAAPPPADVDLMAHCREHLAGFKLPRRIAFLASLPRTPSGKIDRQRTIALARPVLRPVRA